MSFYLDMPQYPSGSIDPAVAEIFRYLYQTASQLNYALSFLNLPEASPSAGGKQDGSDRVAMISRNSTHAQTASARAVYEYAVPQTRKINGQEMTDDIALTAEDVEAVPVTREVNGHALTEDVTLVPADLGEALYVTETGSNNDGWRWRTWSDGTVEMWASSLQLSFGGWQDWTTELKYATASITYPITLSDAAGSHVQVTQTTYSGVTEINGLLLIAIKGTSGAQIRFVRKTNATTVRVDVYVRGVRAI